MENIIKQTQCWLDSVIIEHNICPFAKRERDKASIRFFVSEAEEMTQVLEQLVLEWERLDEQHELETTLFILAHVGRDFEEFLDLLDIANELLLKQGCEGVYQLASFHPEYCFEGSDNDDPANYTNRSPHPMLHIIREKSLENVLETYPEPELIPVRNIDYCQSLGLEKMQQMLADCLAVEKK